MTSSLKDECSINYDIKVVSKVLNIPVVTDTVSEIERVTTTLRTIPPVKVTEQYMKHGMKVFSEIPAVQDCVGIFNHNTTINGMKNTLHPHMATVVGQLDEFACGSIDTLTSALPALTQPTPQLMQVTKETATGYAYMLQEYLASFTVSQVSMKVVDKSLSIAEKSVKYLQPVEKCPGIVCSTYNRIRRTRRSMRALRRAGQRKNRLNASQIARVGLVGRLADYLKVNSALSLIGLELRVSRPCSPASGSLRLPAASLAELKGDLSEYCSDEDPDFHPESESSVDGSSSSSASSEESDREDVSDKPVVKAVFHLPVENC